MTTSASALDVSSAFAGVLSCATGIGVLSELGGKANLTLNYPNLSLVYELRPTDETTIKY